MEHEIVFDNIKERITSVLSLAQNYIWVAVAWITDSDYLEILRNKIEEGVDVKLVLMADELNRNNLSRFSFLDENVNLFFKDSHHKYCIVDDDVLITGSFNWTNKATHRLSGENILISSSKNAIANTKKNFISLVSGVNAKIKTKTDFYILKAKELSYGEIVDESKKTWWYSLSVKWKVFFIEEVCDDFGTKHELHLFYNELNIEETDDDFNTWEIEKLEEHALNEFLTFILNIVNIKNPVDLDYYLESELPLLALERLKYIKKITFKTRYQWLRLINFKQNLVISSLCILDGISSEDIPDNIAENLDRITLNFLDVEKNVIDKFKKRASFINLYGEKKANIHLKWFLKSEKLKFLSLAGFELYDFDVIGDLANSIDKINIESCWIHDATRDFILEKYSNLEIDHNCYFWSYGNIYLDELNHEFVKKRTEDKRLSIGTSEYKYFDDKGNRYKFVEEGVFMDKYGNVFNFFYDGILKDVFGDYANEDGTITPF